MTLTDFFFSNDIESNHSGSSSTSTIRELVGGSRTNETEIVRAPQHYINSIDDQILHNLETIPVTTEAPWDLKGEVLLRVWLDEAKDSSKGHRETGYKLKKLYRILSISVILATGFVFLVTTLFPCNDNSHKYITAIISFTSLIFANLAAFFDFGPKYQSHFQYEGLYQRYVIDINEILSTDEVYRPPKDKTLVEFRERMGNLVTSAPEL
jgi:hypothetical protein